MTTPREEDAALVLVVGGPPPLHDRVRSALGGRASIVTAATLRDLRAWLLHVSGTTDEAPRRLRIDGLLIDLDSHRVTWHGRPLTVSRQEFAILVALAERPGLTASFSHLLEQVWRETHRRDTEVVRAAVKRLRTRLNTAGVGVRIESIAGHGYRLDVGAPVQVFGPAND